MKHITDTLTALLMSLVLSTPASATTGLPATTQHHCTTQVQDDHVIHLRATQCAAGSMKDGQPVWEGWEPADHKVMINFDKEVITISSDAADEHEVYSIEDIEPINDDAFYINGQDLFGTKVRIRLEIKDEESVEMWEELANGVIGYKLERAL